MENQRGRNLGPVVRHPAEKLLLVKYYIAAPPVSCLKDDGSPMTWACVMLHQYGQIGRNPGFG